MTHCLWTFMSQAGGATQRRRGIRVYVAGRLSRHRCGVFMKMYGNKTGFATKMGQNSNLQKAICSPVCLFILFYVSALCGGNKKNTSRLTLATSTPAFADVFQSRFVFGEGLFLGKLGEWREVTRLRPKVVAVMVACTSCRSGR